MGKTGGKGSRARNKDRRKADRRAATFARKALYASEGNAGKRKKPASEGSGFNALKGTHTIHMCGNVGCNRCFPQYALIRL